MHVLLSGMVVKVAIFKPFPQSIEQMLAPYGSIISTRVLRDANGVSRGVGFARLVQKCSGHRANADGCPALPYD